MQIPDSGSSSTVLAPSDPGLAGLAPSGLGPSDLGGGRLIPVLHLGVVLPGALLAQDVAVQITSEAAHTPAYSLTALNGAPGRVLVDPVPHDDLVVRVTRDGTDITGSPLRVQIGGWSGGVEWVQGRLVTGRARNLRTPDRDVSVVAFTASGLMGFATASAALGGHFVMILPEAMLQVEQPEAITLGIAGSDYVLDGGILAPQSAFQAGPAGQATPLLLSAPRQPLAIRIKISTPNLKEAPLWGDYHFANSLSAAFERLGHHAGVDTIDTWYSHADQQDVVLTLRGRQRLKVDPAKINIMWLISHPDRIEDDEYADYDHVAVASDVYAATLRAKGLPSVSVLHQATDATLFQADDTLASDTQAGDTLTRKASCLFVGNSRREYRTMVQWCVQSDLPFDLYGGGWEGILPDDMVRAPSIANKDLPRLYASHQLLLNDHWDSMRDHGFLSNRLFDGSAVGTPILTDPVAGLADVFGDTISTAGTITRFAEIARDALNNPAPYLARALRARQIVLGAHTFDHRARQLSDLIDQLAVRKYRRI